MEIKEMLIQIREQNGYTKKEVSEKTGIPYTTYIKYESGERKDVSMQALCKLADFYHVTTDYLLGRKELPNPLAGLKITVNDKPFIETYQQFPDYVKQILIEAMQKLAEAAQRDDATEGELDTEIACTPLPWAIPPVEESKAIASAEVDTHSLEEPPADESMFENVPKKDV